MKRSATNITWLGGLAFVLLLLGSLTAGGCETRRAEAAAKNTGDAAVSSQARIERGTAISNHVPDPLAAAATTNEGPAGAGPLHSLLR
jgi:hypothetical protein